MNYKILDKQEIASGDYSIVPIRMSDRYDIMNWRNEQMYHLRQSKLLTRDSQDNYFDNTISQLFDLESPDQILFSYLQNEMCIGYGGLVHINWVDKHAELSFIIATDLEEDEFNKHWSIYLRLIEQVAFSQLQFHKLFVYAFDLRPHLYDVLHDNDYITEARLKEHCCFDGQFIDVVILSKIAE